MSEVELAEAPSVEPIQAQVSAGTLLRRARESAGLHVAALAVALKVPVRKLEALEDDRLDDLGDAVFIRALASSVCRTLKVDAQPILERLPQTAAPRLIRDTDGLNAPFRAPGDGPAPSWIDIVRQPVPLAVIALLAGAVILFFVPVTRTEEKLAAAAGPAPSPAPVIPTSAVPVQAMPAPAATEPASASAPGTAPAGLAADSSPVSTVQRDGAVASSSTAIVPIAVASGVASGVLVVHARGQSWVEVTDAKGAVPIRKIMAAGESAGASGALPLTVTVGRADQTEVEVRGKKFDLKPVSKDNVARFEVK